MAGNKRSTSNTVIVPVKTLDAVNDGLIDAGSLLWTAMRQIEDRGAEGFDYSDLLAIKVLLAQSHKRLSENRIPLEELIESHRQKLEQAA